MNKSLASIQTSFLPSTFHYHAQRVISSLENGDLADTQRELENVVAISCEISRRIESSQFVEK